MSIIIIALAATAIYRLLRVLTKPTEPLKERLIKALVLTLLFIWEGILLSVFSLNAIIISNLVLFIICLMATFILNKKIKGGN